MANNAIKSFGQLGVPTLTQTSIPCIVKPNFDAENFELKPHLIEMIERNQFGGDPSENLKTISMTSSRGVTLLPPRTCPWRRYA